MAGKEQAIGHLEQAHPHADQRQVEDDEHQVADPHARDQPPEEVGLLGHHRRAGRDAVNHERAEHQRHRPARGNPQGEHRDELALGVRVVGGLGPATPSIAPWPKRDGSLATFFSIM